MKYIIILSFMTLGFGASVKAEDSYHFSVFYDGDPVSSQLYEIDGGVFLPSGDYDRTFQGRVFFDDLEITRQSKGFFMFKHDVKALPRTGAQHELRIEIPGKPDARIPVQFEKLNVNDFDISRAVKSDKKIIIHYKQPLQKSENPAYEQSLYGVLTGKQVHEIGFNDSNSDFTPGEAEIGTMKLSLCLRGNNTSGAVNILATYCLPAGEIEIQP